ncbi:MAG: AbrB/MazE/SpoVT family DNA-binding domain-containing protein [Candidatus Bathyarchaeia archaeon]|jgi:AbrB family looped-hinge helix DNA binding protein
MRRQVNRTNEEVLVTRKGRVTIPVRVRKKYLVREGTRLEVINSGSGILLKPKPSTVDLAGSGSECSSPGEMKRLLDKMRDSH